MVILLDSSALIEFARATGSPVNLRVRDLIRSEAVVAITPPVAMELLSGVRTGSHEDETRGMLASFEYLAFDAAIDFERAAAIYRRCRAVGITPRDLIDCMIASVAMRHDAAVLSADVDFARIASVVDLKLDPATPR